MSEFPILIIGDGGRTGGRANARLQARGIEEALGRPPRNFSDDARATAATGIRGA